MNHFTRLLLVLSAIAFSAACAPPPPLPPNIEATVVARVEGTATALAAIPTASPIAIIRPASTATPVVRVTVIRYRNAPDAKWATGADSAALLEMLVFASSSADGPLYITEHAIRLDVGTEVRVIEEHPTRATALVQPLSGPYRGGKWYVAAFVVN